MCFAFDLTGAIDMGEAFTVSMEKETAPMIAVYSTWVIQSSLLLLLCGPAGSSLNCSTTTDQKPNGKRVLGGQE